MRKCSSHSSEARRGKRRMAAFAEEHWCSSNAHGHNSSKHGRNVRPDGIRAVGVTDCGSVMMEQDVGMCEKTLTTRLVMLTQLSMMCGGTALGLSTLRRILGARRVLC
ncbi:UNVERIFIED_CONTAM: hypothetical protein Sangu_0548100 [Sesamum angustifolium]|uniref:Uncharacterized protein n=1 Tax=Sesamum angustifolium TaxID=2727405 RepID=A0AAW2Q9G6_9LAMI